MFEIVLAFIACLNSSGTTRCQDVQIPFNGTMMQCMVFGQHETARWIGEHPGWTVARGWRCGSGREA